MFLPCYGISDQLTRYCSLLTTPVSSPYLTKLLEPHTVFLNNEFSWATWLSGFKTANTQTLEQPEWTCRLSGSYGVKMCNLNIIELRQWLVSCLAINQWPCLFCGLRVHQTTTVSTLLCLTLRFHQGQRMWSSLPNMFSVCRHCHTDGKDWKEHGQTEWVATAPSTQNTLSQTNRHPHWAAASLFSDTR